MLKINNVLVNSYNLCAKMQQNSNKLVAVNVEYTSKKTLENIEEPLLRMLFLTPRPKYSNSFLNLKCGFIKQSN